MLVKLHTYKYWLFNTGGTYNSKWLQRKCLIPSTSTTVKYQPTCLETYKIVSTSTHIHNLYYKYVKCMNIHKDQKERKEEKNSLLG